MTLYERFTRALRMLPEDRVPDAVDATEGLFIRLSRHHGMDHVFVPFVEEGRPTDPILAVFDGHTFGEIAQVMSQLRHGLADTLVRVGASEVAVRELREGGVPPDGRWGETA
jgi:hypothetical protein